MFQMQFLFDLWKQNSSVKWLSREWLNISAGFFSIFYLHHVTSIIYNLAFDLRRVYQSQVSFSVHYWTENATSARCVNQILLALLTASEVLIQLLLRL